MAISGNVRIGIIDVTDAAIVERGRRVTIVYAHAGKVDGVCVDHAGDARSDARLARLGGGSHSYGVRRWVSMSG